MTEGIIGTIVAVFFLGIALVLGWSISNDGWARDCDRLGARLHGDKIYECRVRAK